MTTAKILKSWITAALLASASVHAAESSIQVAMEEGKTIAQFKIGDSSCALIDGQIRCTFSTK